MKESLIDRLMLTRERIAGIADGLLQIADLEDPIGIVTDMKVRPNGLRIGKKECLWELLESSMNPDQM